MSFEASQTQRVIENLIAAVLFLPIIKMYEAAPLWYPKSDFDWISALCVSSRCLGVLAVAVSSLVATVTWYKFAWKPTPSRVVLLGSAGFVQMVFLSASHIGTGESVRNGLFGSALVASLILLGAGLSKKREIAERDLGILVVVATVLMLVARYFPP